MSGAAGHLMHLYDDTELTFGEIKDILTRASKGQLEQVTEKLDGRNIVFTWNVKQNDLKVARAAGDIKSGGMNATELAQKFQGRESLEEAFNSAFSVLRTSISSLDNTQRLRIFGPAGNKWYSAEIIYAASPNVVSYDSNSVVFHGFPVFSVDSTGNVEQIDDSSGIEILSSNIEKMQSALKGKDWTVHGPAIVSMKETSDGSALSNAISSIDNVLNQNRITDSETVQDFIEVALKKKLIELGFSGALLNSVHARILRKPGAPDLRVLKKSAPHSSDLLDKTIKSGDKMITSILSPLDKIVGAFAIKILEGLKSSFIGDNEKEVSRLKQATDEAISTIKGNGDQGAIDFLNRQLERLGSTENIKSAVEGVVFRYNGKTYKFTGAFTAANQILGFYRYRQPAKTPIGESYLRNVIRLMLF